MKFTNSLLGIAAMLVGRAGAQAPTQAVVCIPSEGNPLPPGQLCPEGCQPFTAFVGYNDYVGYNGNHGYYYCDDGIWTWTLKNSCTGSVIAGGSFYGTGKELGDDFFGDLGFYTGFLESFSKSVMDQRFFCLPENLEYEFVLTDENVCDGFSDGYTITWKEMVIAECRGPLNIIGYPNQCPLDEIDEENNVATSTFVFGNGCTEPPSPSPPAPAPAPAPAPGMIGDPHILSWSGESFDYMGECDLVLMTSPKFDGKQDLEVHVRTKIRHDYSYIEAAAIKIGKRDVLEVAGWADYALNGVDGALGGDKMPVVPTVGGYQVNHRRMNKKRSYFDVVITENLNITLMSYKDWVSVTFTGSDKEHFGSVSGLMGSFEGKMLARNGTSYHDDINSLAEDWQVHPEEEGKFFRSERAPQYPDKCILPVIGKTTSRRLGEAVAEEAAEKACGHMNGHAFSFCVHDVMASGDLEFAQAGAF